MITLAKLRDRWGGGIRPSISIDRENEIVRWDGEGAGPGWCISFEGFGVTFTLFLGRTPRPHLASGDANA